MKNELTITIIACTIIFSGMGVLAFDTMNQKTMTPDKMVITQGQSIVEEMPITETISVKDLSKNPKITKTTLDDGSTQIMTLTGMIIPENNKHPWGYIDGTVENAAPGYPIIVQFFKSLDEIPVHIAQIDLNQDNSFNYKFRVLSIDDGIATHIFEGDYYVKIFKTVIPEGQT